jgi:nucleoside-diphosphate-sugar epimerase
MKALVTGGGGFLGKAIVKLLLKREYDVASFSRNRYPELTRLGVEQTRGDLTDFAALIRAAKGCDLIFHVAAKAGIWGRYDEFYQPNVIGTSNVIKACQQQQIGRLIYTSSPSVIFDGSDLEGIDESVSYPDHFLSWYPQTKAEAERAVLVANDLSLATVALRPHLIWGPEDNHLVPRILEQGRAGALRRIGREPCLVDTVYIDNAAEAHILAAEKLSVGSVVAGKSYFIANNEPLPLWELVNRILATDGIPAVEKSISPRLAYAVGGILETIYRLFRLSGEPRMTRFVAKELSTAHWFDLSAAKQDFGYQPQVSIEEGLSRLHTWLKQGH